jgi:hypothetical protein
MKAKVIGKSDTISIENVTQTSTSLDTKKARMEKFLKIFPESNFNISESCRRSGIGRRTFYRWIDSDPEFRESFESSKSERLDIAEDQLFQKVLKGDTVSILFFLKCQGKHRGWIENDKQRIEISKAPSFDQEQMDALVRGQLSDRNKYQRMLDLNDSEPDD